MKTAIVKTKTGKTLKVTKKPAPSTIPGKKRNKYV